MSFLCRILRKPEREILYYTVCKKCILYNQFCCIKRAAVGTSFRKLPFQAHFSQKLAMSDALFFIDREGHQPVANELDVSIASAIPTNGNAEDAPVQSNASDISDDNSDDSGIARILGNDEPVTNGSRHFIGERNAKPKRRNLTSGAVWHDDDDDKQHVDLLYQPRRKKLREDLQEGAVSVAEYAERLRRMHRDKFSGRGLGGWAQLPTGKKSGSGNKADSGNDSNNSSGDDGGETDEDDGSVSQDVTKLLRSANSAMSLARKGRCTDGITSVLKPGILDLRVVTDANIEEPNAAEARCVDFHPTGRIIMTAGLDKTVRLFAMDGKQNTKLQSIHLRNFPIHSAHFACAGEEVVATGRRRYFHTVDLQTGRVTQINTLSSFEERSWEHMKVSHNGSRLALTGQHGRVVVLCSRSKRNIGQLRVNGHVADVAFSRKNDGDHELYTCSTDGTVYLWDLRTMNCIDKHRDEGAVHSTCLAATNGRYAVGSDSGVVNVYSEGTLCQGQLVEGRDARTETPAKRLLNLRTRIDNIAFNTDGQLMAFASHEKKGAVRIVHTASMSVFSNWPTARSSVTGRVCSLTFSPSSGFLAVGESSGRVRLLRLKAYPAC